MGIHLYERLLFLLLLLKFSFFGFWQLYCNISWWRKFWIDTLGGLLSSWIWMSKSLPRFGKLWVIISLYKLSMLFSLSSPSGNSVIHTLFFLMVPFKFHKISLFLLLPFYFCSTDCIISIDLSSNSLILSFAC